MERAVARYVAYEEALRAVEEHTEPIETSASLPAREADGRIAAETVTAPRDVPHYDRAAMDGYAVRAEDTRVESGGAALDLVDGSVEPGTAARVHTGSALPEGADAVVRQEHVRRRDGAVVVERTVEPGCDVGPSGEDVERGDTMVSAGDELTPVELALLRSSGVDTIEVYDRPRAVVVPTGDEVVERDPEPGEVVETNAGMVASFARRYGADAERRGIVPDDRRAIERTIVDAARDGDVVVTTGGSSVGDRDHTVDAVDAVGDLVFHEVAEKPGHPVGFGVVEDVPVLALPGYPVSAVVTAHCYLRPAVRRRARRGRRPALTTEATLATEVATDAGVRHFVRVALEGDEAVPTPGGSGALSSVIAADGWLVVEEDRETVPAGTTVTVERWRETAWTRT